MNKNEKNQNFIEIEDLTIKIDKNNLNLEAKAIKAKNNEANN